MRVWVIILASLCAACGTAPRPHLRGSEIEVREAWTVQTDTAQGEEGNWWSRLGDPGLDSLVAVALKRNQDLRAAAARMRAAEAQARIAGAPWLPQFNAGFNGSNRKQVFVGLPIPGQTGPLSSESTSYGVSLNVSWELDVWGRLSAEKAAAVSDRQAAQATYAGAKQSLAAQTAKAWFALTEANRQHELARATVDNYETTLQQVEERYRRGIRPSLDVRLTRSELAAARDQLHQRAVLLDRARRQLEVILGGYPEGKLSPGRDLPTLTEQVPAGLPADLVSRRPDLVASERRLAASTMRHKEARRARYPRISLTGSTGRSSGDLSDLLDGDFTVWSFVGNLIQPLFQGGRIQGTIDLTSAIEEDAVATYVADVLRAYFEVENTLTAESALASREADLTIAAEEALGARRLSEDRYRRGLTDLITMLSAQRTAYLTESQLLGVRRLRLDTRIDLHLALGGDFTDREDVLTTASTAQDSGETVR